MPETEIYKPSYLGMAPTLLVFGLIFLFSFFSMLAGNPFSMIFILILIIVVTFVSYLSIKMTCYELRPDGLFIKHGIIAKKQALLLYSQIQDVTESQSFWEGIFGLKELEIKTMTLSSTIAGSLNNLTSEDAEKLRFALLQRINSKTSKNQKSPSATAQYKFENPQEESPSNPYPVHFTRYGIVAIFFSLWIIILGYEFFSFFKVNAELTFDFLLSGIIIIIIPISFFVSQFTFKYWIGKNTVSIKTGLLSTNWTIMAYDKIQDLIFSQGIIARILGLASIKFETGSQLIYNKDKHQRPNYDINALKKDDANSLVKILMKKIGIDYSPSPNPLVQQLPLSKIKIIKKTMTGLLGLLVIIIILLTISWLMFQAENSATVIFATLVNWIIIVFIALAIYIPIYQKMYYDRYFYDLSKNALTIRKGVIGRRQIYLPFEKIQNVFMNQDLLDRIFRLYDIHLSTIGQSSVAMCHIDGLSKKNADNLLTILLKQIKENN